MRVVQFFDGAQSETTPTIGNIVASSLVQYSDDATYEANEQGAPAEGNVYFNTTLNLIRYYNGTNWISLVDETSSQTIQNKTVDGSSSGNNDVKTIASKIEVTPTGNLAANDAQEALEELQGDINALDTRLDTAEADIIDLQNDKENKSEKGQPNGYAPLDASSLIPSIHLPSYVDDVLEYANVAAFPLTGETGKIYVALDTNFQYRWSGSIYVQLAASPVNSVNGQTGVVVLNIDDINDVVAPTPADEDVLTWDSVTNKWINQSVPRNLDALSDVTLTAPTNGQVLAYNGSVWTNQSPSGILSTTSKTANYTAVTTDDVIFVNSASGTFTITLYTAVGNTGRQLRIVKTNNTNKVTIDGNASETIGGNLTVDLFLTNDSITIVSDGSNWQIMSYDITGPTLVVTGSSTSINAAGANITPTTISNDSHGWFSGTTYTVQQAGRYNVSCYIRTAAIAFAAGDSVTPIVRHNTTDIIVGLDRVAAAVNAGFGDSGSIILNCAVGDTIIFKGAATQTVALNGATGFIGTISFES